MLMAQYSVRYIYHIYRVYIPFTLIITIAGVRAILKVPGHQVRWLGPGNRTFLEAASMMVT